MSRKEIRSVVGLLKGHGSNKHIHTMGVMEDPTCVECCEDDGNLTNARPLEELILGTRKTEEVPINDVLIQR